MTKRKGTIRKATQYRGVYERVSEERINKNKPDICFDIAYRIDKKLTWEKIGWLSEGYTAKLADQVRSERLRTIRHGQELPRQKAKAPFFKDVSEDYLKWAEENRVQKGIIEKYRYTKHIKGYFAKRRLNEITSFDIERFKSDLSKKGLSPASVKHCLVIIREIFNKAKAWNLYKGENPIKGVKMPVLQNQRERFLSYEEADNLLKVLKEKSEALHDIALLSLHTGARAGEIFKLRGYDLDFENDLINVSDTKNKAARKVYMTEAVKETLLQRKPEKPESFVFTDRSEDKKKIESVSNTFSRVVKSLNLNQGITDRRQKITFHSLRHTFASWLALRGETIQTIAELLGHKSLAMTMRYSHLTADHRKQAIKGLEMALNGKNGKVVSIDEVK
jgi:integrase